MSSSESIYNQYIAQYGYPPKQPAHIQSFAKTIGASLSYAEARNIINSPPSAVNNINNNNNVQLQSVENEGAISDGDDEVLQNQTIGKPQIPDHIPPPPLPHQVNQFNYNPNNPPLQWQQYNQFNISTYNPQQQYPQNNMYAYNQMNQYPMYPPMQQQQQQQWQYNQPQQPFFNKQQSMPLSNLSYNQQPQQPIMPTFNHQQSAPPQSLQQYNAHSAQHWQVQNAPPPPIYNQQQQQIFNESKQQSPIKTDKSIAQNLAKQVAEKMSSRPSSPVKIKNADFDASDDDEKSDKNEEKEPMMVKLQSVEAMDNQKYENIDNDTLKDKFEEMMEAMDIPQNAKKAMRSQSRQQRIQMILGYENKKYLEKQAVAEQWKEEWRNEKKLKRKQSIHEKRVKRRKSIHQKLDKINDKLEKNKLNQKLENYIQKKQDNKPEPLVVEIQSVGAMDNERYAQIDEFTLHQKLEDMMNAMNIAESAKFCMRQQTRQQKIQLILQFENQFSGGNKMKENDVTDSVYADMDSYRFSRKFEGFLEAANIHIMQRQYMRDMPKEKKIALIEKHEAMHGFIAEANVQKFNQQSNDDWGDHSKVKPRDFIGMAVVKEKQRKSHKLNNYAIPNQPKPALNKDMIAIKSYDGPSPKSTSPEGSKKKRKSFKLFDWKK